HLLHVFTTATWYTADAVKMLVRLLITSSTIFVYVLLLFLLSWQLTLLVGAGLLLISIGIRVFTRTVRGFGEKATQANAELADAMVEGVDGMRVIRAFGRESHHQTRLNLCSERARDAYFRTHVLEEAVHPLHDCLAGIVLLLILFLT